MKKTILSIIAAMTMLPCPSQADLAKFKDQLYDKHGLEISGFMEVRSGWRCQSDSFQRDDTINEGRIQLEIGREIASGQLNIKTDLVNDLVVHQTRGELRDLNLLTSPLEIMDLKIGRQILTWGTGDLLFINDLFPKDWQSFFIGRDDQYLKAPSDAIKASLFFESFDLDLVYVPVFNSSNYIKGERISYWNSLQNRTAGNDFIFHDQERNSLGDDSEFAMRLSRNLAGLELALYAYSGFWKTPEGMNGDLINPRLIYPRLSVYGASIRGPLAGGIAHLEGGYYDSRQDRGGDNPLIRNSESRVLAGFERELGQNLTGAIQFYLEWMADYNTYEQALPVPDTGKDELRSVITLRLTRLMLNQNLRLSLFAYYSPSDQDSYLRPRARYQLNDQLTIEAGANIFLGADDHTFFGQFRDNTNIYSGLRWNF